MGAGASVIPEEGVNKEQAKEFFGDAFDEAKFDELAGESGKLTREQAFAFPNSPICNSALVFIKPHANTEATKTLVKDALTAKGCTILREGTISGTEIDEKKLIDQHYYAIASKATILKPEEYFKPEVLGDKFKEKFAEDWETVKSEGRVKNALDAAATFECDVETLDNAWRQAEKDGMMIKFGGGYYCAHVTVGEKPPLYIFNAFFMNMRSKFVGESKSITYYSIEWKSADMTWKDFRGNLIGPTNPANAPAESIRGSIASRWQELGLPGECNGADNGVHASASPLEGLAEKMNWLQKTAADEGFGAALLRGGVSEETIKAWCLDCQVLLDLKEPVADSVYGGIFDALEDVDVDDCLARCIKINADTAAAAAAATAATVPAVEAEAEASPSPAVTEAAVEASE